MKKVFTFFAVAALAFTMASCGGKKEAAEAVDFDALLGEMTELAEKAEAAGTQEAKDALNAEFEALGEKLVAFEGTLTEEQQAALDELNERYWNAYNNVALPEAEEAAEEPAAEEAPAEGE
ncbi:MAG: hypothetical protein IJ767_00720 [Bacteroidaceae bacterium]|nr:hypothetical protein [Bacteroidaceae bacterium]MBR1682936.1 hypothetical protein [Bacteroidaceae bacterium]MBR1800008.1 hypothetical protein [Bacteroidaceae bacterium]